MSEPESPDLHVVPTADPVAETGRIPDDDETDTESLSARENKLR